MAPRKVNYVRLQAGVFIPGGIGDTTAVIDLTSNVIPTKYKNVTLMTCDNGIQVKGTGPSGQLIEAYIPFNNVAVWCPAHE